MTRPRSLIPPLITSFNERKAHFKNLQEQIRLDKLLDHLNVQEHVYVQMFRKERQVAELRRTRALAVRVKSHSCSQISTTLRPASTSAGSLPRSTSPAVTNENNAEYKTKDRQPVQPWTTQTPHLQNKPPDNEEPRPHHLLLLLTPDEASNIRVVEIPSNKDQSTVNRHKNTHASDQLQLIQRGSTKFSDTDGPGDYSDKQSTLDTIPDNSPAVVERCDLVPAVPLLKTASASTTLLPVTDPVDNTFSTRRSDNFARYHRPSANSFHASTPPSKSHAEQKTLKTHQTCNEKQTEIPSLTGKYADAADEQKIARRITTAEIATTGRITRRMATANKTCVSGKN